MKNTSKIILVMGKSATGKDTIYKKIVENTNLIPIVPYTTRPIRVGEVDGVNYYFVDDDYFKNHSANVIESRTYDTIHGKWTYGELYDHQFENTSADYILITTLESYPKFVEYFGEENIIPVYINVENGTRLQRALDREKSQKNPKYEEMCRRFVADEKDFSEERLKECNIEKYYENTILNDTVNNIISDLKELNIKI